MWNTKHPAKMRTTTNNTKHQTRHHIADHSKKVEEKFQFSYTVWILTTVSECIHTNERVLKYAKTEQNG